MNEQILLAFCRQDLWASTKSMPTKKMKNHFLRIAYFLVRLTAHGQKI